MSPEVAATFDAYPVPARKKLLVLRQLILDTAAENPAIGPLTETLKWSEPAYLTKQTGSGTTVRLGWKEAEPDRYRLLVHCQTSLVDTCRALYPELHYDGNRAIVFDLKARLPAAAVRHCIELALTYHLNKHKRAV